MSDEWEERRERERQEAIALLSEKVEALEQMAARHEAELKQIFEVHCEMLLDRINQLVEFHGILPIDRGDKP